MFGELLEVAGPDRTDAAALMRGVFARGAVLVSHRQTGVPELGPLCASTGWVLATASELWRPGMEVVGEDDQPPGQLDRGFVAVGSAGAWPSATRSRTWRNWARVVTSVEARPRGPRLVHLTIMNRPMQRTPGCPLASWTGLGVTVEGTDATAPSPANSAPLGVVARDANRAVVVFVDELGV